MKKNLIFIGLVGLLLLGGCNISKDRFVVDVEAIHEQGKVISYTVPSIAFSGLFTGVVEKKFFADIFGNKIINGYGYLYRFTDLGISFHFIDIAAQYTDPHNPYFFEPYMYYSGNVIFYQKTKGKPIPSVYIFSKSTENDLSHIIKKDHSHLFVDGCTLQAWQGGFSLLSGNSAQYTVFTIQQKDSNICFPGLFFVEDKKKLDRYYMIFHPDACAPSCDTFSQIEFF